MEVVAVILVLAPDPDPHPTPCQGHALDPENPGVINNHNKVIKLLLTIYCILGVSFHANYLFYEKDFFFHFSNLCIKLKTRFYIKHAGKA